MVVRSFDIQLLLRKNHLVAGNPGSLIRCTPYRQRSRTILQLRGTSVPMHSPGQTLQLKSQGSKNASPARPIRQKYCTPCSSRNASHFATNSALHGSFWCWVDAMRIAFLILLCLGHRHYALFLQRLGSCPKLFSLVGFCHLMILTTASVRVNSLLYQPPGQ